MDTVVRGALVYLVLLLIFRVAGKRTLAQATTFDLVLTLIISEAVQQALIDTDNSMTNALLLVVSLIGLDILLSLAKQRSPRLQRIMEGLPVLVIEDGRPRRDHMKLERVDESDVLGAARELQGLRRLDEIAYAVVEQSGNVTVIPKEPGRGER